MLSTGFKKQHESAKLQHCINDRLLFFFLTFLCISQKFYELKELLSFYTLQLRKQEDAISGYILVS